jgi:hypothetical protein
MTLNEILIRLRTLLADPDGDLFTDQILTENLRLALVKLQKICPLVLQVSGLDEAQTTVLAGLENLLIRQTRWPVLWQRLQSRSEMYHPDPPGWDSLENYLTAEQHDLDSAFEQQRLSYMQSSTIPPYAVWPDDDLG